jgi:lysophospholipase
MTSKPYIHPFITFILIGLVGSLVQAQSYAPINVTCPTDLIRYGDNGLSPLETQYIAQRRTKATENLATGLGLAGLQDFNVSSFLANQSNAPTLAIAFSGGGYRAMLNGAGVFQGHNNNIVRRDF